MPRGFVELFECPIEGRNHYRFAPRTVGRVDCLVFCIVGVVFGQISTFILCGGDADMEEQVVAFVQLS